MTPEEKKEIRSEIEKNMEQARQTIESLRDQVKPVPPDDAIGRITRMDAIQQKNMSEASMRTAEETLYKLEQALGRLDEPDFGICGKCGKAIPLGRILIVPETRLCVPCASTR